MKEQAVHKHPRIQGGVPVFTGTRVPVKNLFDYLEAGEPLEQFLLDFPAVRSCQGGRSPGDGKRSAGDTCASCLTNRYRASPPARFATPPIRTKRRRGEDPCEPADQAGGHRAFGDQPDLSAGRDRRLSARCLPRRTDPSTRVSRAARRSAIGSWKRRSTWGRKGWDARTIADSRRSATTSRPHARPPSPRSGPASRCEARRGEARLIPRTAPRPWGRGCGEALGPRTREVVHVGENSFAAPGPRVRGMTGSGIPRVRSRSRGARDGDAPTGPAAGSAAPESASTSIPNLPVVAPCREVSPHRTGRGRRGCLRGHHAVSVSRVTGGGRNSKGPYRRRGAGSRTSACES